MKNIKPINIGIIGYGIVGEATAYGFSKTSKGKDKILYYDKYKESSPLDEVISQSEFLFIALPTPMKKNESGIDLSIIFEMMEKITKLTDGTDKIIIIKSTVIPGTTVKLEKLYPKTSFCFNPEFLEENHFLTDFLNAPRTVIGANKNLVLKRVVNLYQSHFPKTKIFPTDPTTAEAVKYFANMFLATKVTFANTFYDFCQAIGTDYDKVREIAAADPRIVDAHLKVTKERGFGKKCFPKDMIALLGEYKRLGVDASVFKTIWKYNKKIRKVHEWEDIPFAVSGNHKAKK